MSTLTYLAVTFEMGAHQEDELAEVLARHGVVGSELAPSCDGRVEATVYPPFSDGLKTEALCRDLEGLATGKIRIETRHSQDWLAAYRESLTAFALGRIWWIDPAPEHPTAAPAGRRRLVVEPRMAFGTGSHASTHLVLLELEEHPPTGQAVLDVGTGSGILSLASEMLGSSWTVGLDIDPQAVFVAQEAVADQEHRCSPAYLAGPLDAIAGAHFDLVLCNMLSSEFTPLLGAVRNALNDGGTAVFSGILGEERRTVEAELSAVGLKAVGTRRREEWMSIRARVH